MIFVTVGTHEQPFDRLVKYMDEWARDNDEKVVIQTGYCGYEPGYAEWSRLYPYEKMKELTDQARIVISHGGPSSFIMSLQAGKIPIVVPRMACFKEHVNDHQVSFCRKIVKRWGNILVVQEMGKLSDVIKRYDEITKDMNKSFASNNERFCEEFEKIVEGLLAKD
ncbi:MAG: multidrug MFS transporter [Lachnospiraceae bacterium]|nr:multidrug MFS transporter [Lachnospiraceae bacterium]